MARRGTPAYVARPAVLWQKRLPLLYKPSHTLFRPEQAWKGAVTIQLQGSVPNVCAVTNVCPEVEVSVLEHGTTASILEPMLAHDYKDPTVQRKDEGFLGFLDCAA